MNKERKKNARTHNETDCIYVCEMYGCVLANGAAILHRPTFFPFSFGSVILWRRFIYAFRCAIL